MILKILLKKIDSTELKNELFKVKIEKNNQVFYEKEHFTNDLGHIIFSIDPNSDCGKECIHNPLTLKPEQYSLKVSFKKQENFLS